VAPPGRGALAGLSLKRGFLARVARESSRPGSE
jgi:hypothetical protein